MKSQRHIRLSPVADRKDRVYWSARIFSRSVPKQRKFKEIRKLLGRTEGLHCLDLGTGNGAISHLLRSIGGRWKSADIDQHAIMATRELGLDKVYWIDGVKTPFKDGEFDRIVIVDLLEHLAEDGQFIRELARIMKPGGKLIVNVPHQRNGLLRSLRIAIGQTDEGHGHLRPGYTVASLMQAFGDHFAIETHATYSKFFSELFLTLVNFGQSLLDRKDKTEREQPPGNGGSGKDQRSIFRIYSLIFPLAWLVSRLDSLLFFDRGYMLIVKAGANR